MSSRLNLDMDTNTPTHCFHNLCQVMLDGSSNDLTKKNIEDFRVILHIIMHECSKANIESGKVWISEHCRTPAHATALMEYILSLSKSRKGQQERIHIIYLISDILFHAARRQLHWLKESILSLLVPLLCLAYESTETSEYKAKVVKVISLWGDSNIFEPHVINHLKQSLTGNQQVSYDNRGTDPYEQRQQSYSYPQQQQQQQQQMPLQHQYHLHNSSNNYAQPYLPPQQHYTNYNQPPPTQRVQPPPSQRYQQPPERSEPLPPQRSQLPPSPVNLPPTPPQKPYFELPAGLMIITKNGDYTPINPSMIKLMHPRPPPSKEILEAVKDFYKRLDLSMENDSILEEKNDDQMDAQGWEKGYLDFHYEAIANKKKEKEKSRQLKSESRYEDDSRDRSHSYNRRHSPRRRRSPSPRRMSPPSSRRRNYSPPSHVSRGRSPPPRRRSSLPPRSRSPIRRNSPPRDRYRSRRYSRSRSPPSSSNSFQHSNSRSNRGDFGGGAPENRYLGLGNAASDEFDSFRRNKSQAYNRREPHQPMTCYKCNKVGHLARECQSL